MTPYKFDDRTPEAVRVILTNLNEARPRPRVRLFLGDTKTGTVWLEEYDVIGTIGKSTGTQPAPLLINNARSMGGGAILDHCILKIIRTDTGRVLYEHPKFNNPADDAKVIPSKLPDYAEAVEIDGTIYANFKKNGQAARWIEFMQGKRFAK